MAENQNTNPLVELRVPARIRFLFGVDHVMEHKETGSTILVGQVFVGKIQPGAIVSYGPVVDHKPTEQFACLIAGIQAPNPETQTLETVEEAKQDGALGARYALAIMDRAPKFFKPGDVVFAE